MHIFLLVRGPDGVLCMVTKFCFLSFIKQDWQYNLNHNAIILHELAFCHSSIFVSIVPFPEEKKKLSYWSDLP